MTLTLKWVAIEKKVLFLLNSFTKISVLRKSPEMQNDASFGFKGLDSLPVHMSCYHNTRSFLF